MLLRLMELQHQQQERCQGERKSQIHGIHVATAAKELCPPMQMLRMPHYLDSEWADTTLTQINLFC